MDSDVELMRSALETFPEPIVVWSTDGRLRFANRRFLEIFGVQRSQLDGVDEEGFAQVLAEHGAVLHRGPFSYLAKEALQFERRSRLLTGGGRLDAWHETSGDSQAARRREEILGVISHDLRSPLANVRSYASLLLTGRVAELEPRVKRSAEVIARNTDRALRLLQSYFDTVRADTGEFEIDGMPTPLTGLLQDVLASRRPIAAEKGIELEAELPENLPTARVDRDRVFNAIAALLDNAIERSAPQERLVLRCEVRPSDIWIGVSDHAGAVSPADLRTQFDRDEQILKERRLGTGFALAVARAVARAHGGNAGATSTPQETTFYLTLRGESQPPERAAPPSPQPGL